MGKQKPQPRALRYGHAGPPHSTVVGGYLDQVSIHPESSHPFLLPSYHQKEMMIKKREKEIGSKKKEKRAHVCT
jgi:hypothetical protein